MFSSRLADASAKYLQQGTTNIETISHEIHCVDVVLFNCNMVLNEKGCNSSFAMTV